MEGVERIGAGQERKLEVDGAVRIGHVVRRHQRPLSVSHHEGHRFGTREPHGPAPAPLRDVRIQLVRSDRDIDVEPAITAGLHRLSDQVRAEVVVLLQGEGDRAFLGVEHHERCRVVIELVPVVEIAHQSQGHRHQPRQRGGQAAHAEHQVVDGDCELLVLQTREERRPEIVRSTPAYTTGRGISPPGTCTNCAAGSSRWRFSSSGVGPSMRTPSPATR